MKEFTILGFVEHLTAMAMTMPVAEHRALEHATEIVQTEAKRVVGTYDYGWPRLAEATQKDRVRQGYPADEPGLRSGEMRASIERQVKGHEGHVGSDNDKLVYFEVGTAKQPPRSVLMAAAVHKTKEIGEAIGRDMHSHLEGRALPSP